MGFGLGSPWVLYAYLYDYTYMYTVADGVRFGFTQWVLYAYLFIHVHCR